MRDGPKAYFYPNKFRSDWDVDGDRGGLIFDGNSLFQLTDRAAKSVPPEVGSVFFLSFLKIVFSENRFGFYQGSQRAIFLFNTQALRK